jgi:hypothetical protein
MSSVRIAPLTVRQQPGTINFLVDPHAIGTWLREWRRFMASTLETEKNIKDRGIQPYAKGK